MRHHDQIVSYGPDTVEPHVRAAGYVDRIFKGEKATSLPVQAPTEYPRYQPQDREGTRIDSSAIAARPRGRAD